MIKLNFKSDIFRSSNKFIFHKFLYNFFICIKVSKLYQLNIIKNIKKDCKKKACEKCQNLSKEEKEKKWQYGYKNL